MAGIAQVEDGLDACHGSSALFLSDDDLVASLDAVMVMVSRLAALQFGLVREFDGRSLAKAQGATTTLAWVKARYLVDHGTAAKLVALGADLDLLAPTTLAALAAGAINPDHVAVICQTLKELPEDVDPATRAKAEEHLLGFAGEFEPVKLRTLGRRILDTVDPEQAEQREAELLRKQEERAYAARSFNLSPDHLTGRVKVTGSLDTESAAIVRAALEPLCAPGQSRLRTRSATAAEGGSDDEFAETVDDRTPGQRRADALVDICRLALTTGDLPDSGGDRPQITVMADYDTITRQLRAATLDTGQRLSPDSARRLACDCGILPALMNSTGQVLDLGRERRLWTGPARKAILLRDGGCAFPGCDRPPRWTDIHHIRHWQHGGASDRDNGVALCGHHHRVIHQGHWTVKIAPDGRPEFTPPTYVDRQQRPRRNNYHRRL